MRIDLYTKVVLTAVENNLPWGRRLSAPLGASLLARGLVWLAVLP